ncbi:iron dicitrate transport regulator FecR (plasmid) [Azospirillum humicireducens]|uniref:Iron dicitrate transport regulator FecR n=1 Tax=Azospirillum humicireducens TaxID=1226968 RepID=A0A2R4VQ46_9PROT|nr:FecR family protein [Azospirillum humicireducens]AWB06541.1 iron dicitrate transport regulator FecR [Azospirillum humicireducens]
MRQDSSNGEKAESGYRHADPVTDAALDWFVRLLDTPADPATLAAYRTWRQSDPRHAQAFDRLAEVGGMAELHRATLAHLPAAHLPANPLPLPSRPAGRPGAHSRRAWMGAIAATGMLAVVGTQLYPDLKTRWSADHRTAVGERREVALPDGSRVILDSGSAVALAFGGEERRVALLRGRAWFDVVRDTARPFRVVAGFSTVEVTGTAFSVQSDDHGDSVFLERGRVTVSRLDDPGRPVTLSPGDRLTATARGLTLEPRPDPAEALSWRDGRYAFHNERFDTVVETLRRYHAAPILLLNDRIAMTRVSGNYRLDDPAGTLAALAEMVGARMTSLPGGILVLR